VLQQAELSQAQAQLSIARANLRRNEELVAANFVAQRVLDESRANLQVAEAQVALAQARLQRMRVEAPFDGTVGLSKVNLGEFVKDGADLVNLEDTSSLTVDFRLPERYQDRVAVGQRVQVRLDALPGQQLRPVCRRSIPCWMPMVARCRCEPSCPVGPARVCGPACLPVCWPFSQPTTTP
jgi:membrane fusion protein, multidrug efflux system